LALEGDLREIDADGIKEKGKVWCFSAAPPLPLTKTAKIDEDLGLLVIECM